MLILYDEHALNIILYVDIILIWIVWAYLYTYDDLIK
jgi:hypothetical protein